MATRFILLPESAQFPSSNSATYETIHSTERHLGLAFDKSVVQGCRWHTIVPQGWTGTVTAIISYLMTTVNSGTVDFEISVQSVTEADTLVISSNTSYDSINAATDTVPGTIGYLGQCSITLSNMDGAASGDWITFKLERDADDATNDTADGPCVVLGVEIRDGA